MKKHVRLMSLASVALMLVNAVPAAVQSLEVAEKPPSRVLPERLELPHAVSLEEAISSTSQIPSVVGFGFSQPGLLGEIYTGDETAEELAARFRDDYKTDPAVTEILYVDQSIDSEVSSLRLSPDQTFSPNDLSSAYETLAKSDPVDPGPISEESPAFQGFTESRENSENQVPRTNFAVAATEARWAPRFTQIWGMNSSGLAIVAQYHRWFDGRNPGSTPTDWGIEAEIMQSTTASITGIRPACLPANYKQNFWFAKTSSITWAIFTPQGVDLKGVGAYFDWDDMTDSCKLQSATVGIGEPKKLPLDDLGHSEVMTRVQTAASTKVGRSTFGAYHQAVSNDCNDLGRAPDSGCMGLNLDPPMG